MANNGSLQKNFKNPLPEDPFCFEMFGELYFREIPESSSPSLLPRSMIGDIDESKKESEVARKNQEMKKKEKLSVTKNNLKEFGNLKASSKSFPPPITCLGKSGKPRVCLKAYRFDGRLILVENKIPTKEEEEFADEEEGEGKKSE